MLFKMVECLFFFAGSGKEFFKEGYRMLSRSHEPEGASVAI